MANFEINNLTFKTTTENEIISENVTLLKSGEISEYLLTIDFGRDIAPTKYAISWTENLVNAYGFWSPLSWQNSKIGAEWAPSAQNSRTASGLPIISIYNKKNENLTTVYTSDVANASSLSVGVIEASVELKYTLTLFTQIMPKIKNYSVIIRIDNRKTPFYNAIKTAREWWSEQGYKCAYVPNDAKTPLYSFWYSYHQQTYYEDILNECKNAVNYGFKTVIVDDGWQTDDNSGGYAYCGDWEVAKSKIPDMKRLVDEVHNLGLKFILWFSIPFIGYKSKNYERFKGKYLNHVDRLSTSVLDPRFKEVRDFLTEIYVDTVKTYGYDGLKLDFIDRFSLSEISSENYDEMDCRSVEEGLEKLLKEVSSKLKEINPEIIIEFRQSYVGPIVSAYGNIFRVHDCPADAITNKIGSLNLRLTSKETAVHSDMIIWNNFDTNEGVLNQLLGVIFSVPQISVKLDKINTNHQKILKNYLDFWSAKKDTLLNGELKVYGVEFGYTLASSQTENEKISVLYSNKVVEKDGNLIEYIFNASGEDYIYLESKPNVKYEIYDYYGNAIENGVISETLTKLNVNNCYSVKLY